jgi:hypothetical protein
MKTSGEIRAKVRESITALQREAAKAERDAKHYAQAVIDTERDLERGDWQTLARFGFITDDEADMMDSAAPTRNRKRRNRRRTSRR